LHAAARDGSEVVRNVDITKRGPEVDEVQRPPPAEDTTASLSVSFGNSGWARLDSKVVDVMSMGGEE
jgi:hypothetical protein